MLRTVVPVYADAVDLEVRSRGTIGLLVVAMPYRCRWTVLRACKLRSRSPSASRSSSSRSPSITGEGGLPCTQHRTDTHRTHQCERRGGGQQTLLITSSKKSQHVRSLSLQRCRNRATHRPKLLVVPGHRDNRTVIFARVAAATNTSVVH